MQVSPHILIIYGSTASGKSAFAMNVADQLPSVIINADAMQCYDALRIITARPSEADEARHPHALYGIWQTDKHGDVAMWLRAAVQAVKAAWAQNRLPIIVGGTGMYLKALTEGLSAVPEISDDVRKATSAMSHAERYQALCEEDLAMAQTLNEGDTQRVWRALEVVRATGKSLSAWQAEPVQPPIAGAQFHSYKIDVPREVLYDRINQRFDEMMAAGLFEEVRAFLASSSDARSPIHKACGVPEMKAYLANEMTLDEAVNKAKQHSRNYAKRQQTWGRGQFSHATSIAPSAVDDCVTHLRKILEI